MEVLKQLIIYDSVGKLVYLSESTIAEYFDISSYPKGVYTITVRTNRVPYYFSNLKLS